MNENQLDLLFKTKTDLDKFLNEKVREVMIRSKANYQEMGEKSTKYFFNLEKERYNAKTCTKLEINGKEISEQKVILEEQRHFYKKLYTVEKDIVFNLKNESGIKISQCQHEQLSEGVSEVEIAKAVFDLNNGKMCGNDGIPIDFYKFFWKNLSQMVIELVKCCLDSGEFNWLAKMGVINLIPKANKNSKILANQRPITLLNSDEKIIEKIMANRIQPVLGDIIHRNQCRFMADWQIAMNIRLNFGLMALADEKEMEAFIMSVDFQKCFDKIEFTAITGALRYFGFPQNMIDWTEHIYMDFSAVVQNNGHFSKRIRIEWSVHQGGLCSAFYFLLCAEILAIELRSNQKIVGIPVKQFVNTLGQYADDMDLYLKNNKESMEEVMNTFAMVREHTGFTINYEKTTVYRIGSLKRTNFELIMQQPIAWTNGPINVLGVLIDHDKMNYQKINLEKIYVKAQGILEMWTKRNLTLMGKVLIANTLIGSLLVYKLTVLPTPADSFIKKFKGLVTNFIWNKKKPKIAMKILKGRKEDGGLGLFDIQVKDKALKISWVSILKKEPQLSELVYDIMNLGIDDDIWRCNIKGSDVETVGVTSIFWKNVIRANADLRYEKHPPRKHSQFIWFNSMIRRENKPFIFKHAYKAGLKWLGQLYNNGNLISGRIALETFKLSLMEFNSLMSSIPRMWRNELQSNKSTKYNEEIQDITVSKAYSRLIACEDLVYKKCQKWEVDLGCDIPYNTFKKRCMDIYKVTNIVKFRSFQYRLIQRSMITNMQLKKWKMISSDLCTFCGNEVETVLHLLIWCEEVRRIWIDIEQYMDKYHRRQIDFTVKNVIFNRIIDNPMDIKYFICLVTKQYIYCCRCLNKKLCTAELKATIVGFERTEKYIAQKNNNLKKHYNKWY